MDAKKRLVYGTEALTIVVVTILFLVIGSYLESARSFLQVLRSIFVYLIIVYVFLGLLFLTFQYYYLELGNRADQLRSLHSAYLRLSSNLKLEFLCSEALTVLTEFFEGDKGILAITDERLKGYVSSGIFSIQKGSGRRRRAAMYRFNILNPGQILPDLQEKVDELIHRYEFAVFDSIVVLPFFREGATMAVAVVGTRKTDKRFFENVRDAAALFSEQVVTFLENSLLHERINEASITDPLTSLYNRRYFQTRLKEEFASARRKGFPVSVMISDLDNFKYFVDTYGHPRGDVILADAAKLVRSCVRESDIVCRFGGDEFAYLLPYASVQDARNVAERILQELASHVFLKDEKSTRLTMSMGVATFPEHGETETDVLKKADIALFEAKKNGKNTWRVYQQKGESNVRTE